MLHTHIAFLRNFRIYAFAAASFLLAFVGLAVFPVASMISDTEAAPVLSSTTLELSTSDIALSLDVDSPTGTFRESDASQISVATDNYTGYVLNISAGSDGENATKLINDADSSVISSISSASSSSDFINNTWGMKPSKIAGEENSSFVPAPTSEGTTIDTTNSANMEANTYTLSIAAKADYSLSAGKYSNTFVVAAVGNPAVYAIGYDKNVDGDVSNMPATQASDTEDASITLSSTTPTSAKKYKFLSWCDGTVTDNDGIPTCDGTVYNPGDEYNLDQTTENHVVLYGMWDRTATLVDGESFKSKITSLANNNKSNIVAVKSADALPEGFTPATNNIVSVSDSPDIYAWWDNTNDAKTIYIYTNADRIMANSNCKNMFYSIDSLTDISGLSSWDTSKVEDMSYLFSGTKITNLNALSDWDTSSVTNMYNSFGGTKITNVDALSDWDTSNVANMSGMFVTDTLANVSGLSNWDTSSVTNMSSMFHSTRSLTDISGLSNWDTSSVTDMSSMFRDSKITNVNDLASVQHEGKDYVSWDTSSVEDMGCMFCDTASLTDISGLSNWDTSSVTSMSAMFRKTGITNVNALASVQHEGKDYVSWDTSNVINMREMFSQTASLANVSGLSDWDTSNVTDMYNMFLATYSLTDISGLSNWDTSSVENMYGMFRYATRIANVNALASVQHEGKDYVSWDTSSVENMADIFSETSSLTDISGLSNWDTSSVTNMSSMFQHSHIAVIPDLSNWDTSSVTNMSYMFSNNYSLTDISGLSNWDTSSVTDMSSMFCYSKITNVNALASVQHEGKDYVSWDTSSVKNMASMFSNNSSLTDISGLSNWDTSSVLNMSYMFSNNYSLTDISGLSNWDTSNVTNMQSMFQSTTITSVVALSTGQRTGKDYVSWDVSKVTNMSSMFSDCTSLTDPDDLDPLNSWTVNVSLTKTNMFNNIPTSVLRPTWY